ncbi:MAG TPA: hypothetical protein PK677_11400 [Acidiphilium sp.]|nr:hypothetical protein [Acidiphilium sp.]
MSGTALQSLYDLGYSISATVLGTPYQQYRANGANNPTAPANLVGTINAWLTTDAALKGTAQPQYGKPVWYGAFERNGVNIGDYLIGQVGTLFVTSMSYPGAPSLSWCDRVMTVTRPDQPTNYPGASPVYSGDTSQAQAPVMAGWPCSQLQLSSGSTGRKTGMHLPSDASLPLAAFLLPVTAPLAQFNDVLTDDLNRRWYVQMVESSPLGFRLTAQQVAM